MKANKSSASRSKSREQSAKVNLERRNPVTKEKNSKGGRRDIYGK
jgi:hypothetical protein